MVSPKAYIEFFMNPNFNDHPSFKADQLLKKSHEVYNDKKIENSIIFQNPIYVFINNSYYWSATSG